jgi:hypothetical protein
MRIFEFIKWMFLGFVPEIVVKGIDWKIAIGKKLNLRGGGNILTCIIIA